MPRIPSPLALRGVLPLVLAAVATACVKVDEDKAKFNAASQAQAIAERDAGGTAKPGTVVIEETAEEFDPHKRASTSGGGAAVGTAADPAALAGDAPTDPPALFLAPEQVVQNLKNSFNYVDGWTDQDGVFHATNFESYRTLLGGVDFETASVRDHSPKVNTLLVVRNLAYDIANGMVNRAARDEAPDKSVFNKCDIRVDRPYDAADDLEDEEYRAKGLAGERRWRQQVEDIYWRAYSRAPSRDELAAVRSMFARVGHDWPPEGWILILYAIFSTAEFWNL